MRFDSGKNLWPIRIGCLNSKNQMPEWSMKTVQSVTGEDYYFVCTEICKGLKRTGQVSILMSLYCWDLFFHITSYVVVLFCSLNCYYLLVSLDLLASYSSLHARRIRSSTCNHGFAAGENSIHLNGFSTIMINIVFNIPLLLAGVEESPFTLEGKKTFGLKPV